MSVASSHLQNFIDQQSGDPYLDQMKMSIIEGRYPMLRWETEAPEPDPAPEPAPDDEGGDDEPGD